jgi:hypothetical protein
VRVGDAWLAVKREQELELSPSFELLGTSLIAMQALKNLSFHNSLKNDPIVLSGVYMLILPTAKCKYRLSIRMRAKSTASVHMIIDHACTE